MEKKPSFLPKNKTLENFSTELRKNMTKQEKKLWYDFLKKQPQQFNRQRIIGDYIVDFYCHQAKLIIEVDGSEHYQEQAKKYDQQRTDYMQKLGLTVIRFTNQEVDQNFDGVCYRIQQHLKASF